LSVKTQVSASVCAATNYWKNQFVSLRRIDAFLSEKLALEPTFHLTDEQIEKFAACFQQGMLTRFEKEKEITLVLHHLKQDRFFYEVAKAAKVTVALLTLSYMPKTMRIDMQSVLVNGVQIYPVVKDDKKSSES
jgi:hypothetical protein